MTHRKTEITSYHQFAFYTGMYAHAPPHPVCGYSMDLLRRLGTQGESFYVLGGDFALEILSRYIFLRTKSSF